MSSMISETPKIFVGYRTRPSELMESFKPTFTPPANYKDPAKIAEWEQQRQAEWHTEASSYPYLSTFEDVFMAVVGVPKPDVARWHFREKDSGKQPVSLAIRTWLLRFFTDAWVHGIGLKPIFIGFDPRSFLKIWGLECSMPSNASPLPPSVWYGTSNHRDIGEALLPSEYKHVPLAQVLKWRGIEVPDWKGPGIDPELDGRVIAIAAGQLGFMTE